MEGDVTGYDETRQAAASEKLDRYGDTSLRQENQYSEPGVSNSEPHGGSTQPGTSGNNNTGNSLQTDPEEGAMDQQGFDPFFDQELEQALEEEISQDLSLTEEQKEKLKDVLDRVREAGEDLKERQQKEEKLQESSPQEESGKESVEPAEVQEKSLGERVNDFYADGSSQELSNDYAEQALDRGSALASRYQKVQTNTALARDTQGYQLAMNELGKDLGTEMQALDQAIIQKNSEVDQAAAALRENYDATNGQANEQYRQLASNLQEAQQSVRDLKKQRAYLGDLQQEAYSSVPEELRGCTFRSAGGGTFSDTYEGMITQQGAAYPDHILNDCGVCTMANLANQKGSLYTEESALAKAVGNYEYIPITEGMSREEYAYALQRNGLTSISGQGRILESMGYEAELFFQGAGFDEIVDRISRGHSMSLNLYGEDLKSGETIAARQRRGWFLGDMVHAGANHAVTIAGLAEDADGTCRGFFVNDTGGYGGENNPSIYISREKYEQMLSYTDGISSVACRGRKGV
ncbi:MAG: hypothetical protein HFI32_11985 [Lachnospiraceae bacterium]|nr:hypothetical protein [Lachnospiraceae bacterium]